MSRFSFFKNPFKRLKEEGWKSSSSREGTGRGNNKCRNSNMPAFGTIAIIVWLATERLTTTQFYPDQDQGTRFGQRWKFQMFTCWTGRSSKFLRDDRRKKRREEKATKEHGQRHEEVTAKISCRRAEAKTGQQFQAVFWGGEGQIWASMQFCKCNNSPG